MFRDAASSFPSIHSCSMGRMLEEGRFGTNDIICRSFFLKALKDSRSIAIKSILLAVFIRFANKYRV
jgi:hypothetical protein